MTTTECRRCSECKGQEHHWMESGDFGLYYECKHCDARCHELDDEDGLPYPSGVVVVVRRVFYIAHPVSPANGHTIEENLSNAYAWVRFLRASEPSITFIAPWLVNIASGEDDDKPAVRERGLVDCESTVAICNGLVLTGGSISSGMARELAVAERVVDIDVDDLTGIGYEPPPAPIPGILERMADSDRSQADVLHEIWTSQGKPLNQL